MKLLLTLSKNDFRNTFRDPMFRSLLFFPIISFAIIYWGVPAIEGIYPPLAPYKPVILMWACLQSATMFGFIYGFLFLEEKEDGIWQAVRLLPISGLQLAFSRMLIGLVISFIVNFVLIYFGGMVQLPLFIALLLSALYSLTTVLIALWLGAMGRNKIEGIAQMKVLNIALILPGIIYILPYKALHATAIVPTYWLFRSTEAAIFHTGNMGWFFAVGLLSQVLAIFLLNRKMQRDLV